MTGRTISHYEVLDKLGEGGMGVVYKARDTHLDRFVAIKVLPSEKVADPERKRRFVQEAKAASALNHPNIITIHDIDQAEGIDFILMEFVAGKTLDRLIPRHGMRLNDALKCAVQIADGLARAHAAGIIHRDLKPGNIMVDEHGLVKVLDFGLAKLTEPGPAAEDDATRTMRPVTEEGKIVGTVAYMSPEQAEGKPVDARSDIFSFGSVLYEMVTGRRAFQEDTKASTIAAILREEPKPPSQVVDGLPREVERIVRRCLRKDLEHRFQTMADLRVALEEVKEESDSGALETAGPAKPKRRRWLLWAAGVATVLVMAVAGVWFIRPRTGTPEAPLTAVPLTSYPGAERFPSFSPDGTQVAFQWCPEGAAIGKNCDIYVKQIGVEPPSRLTDTASVESSPAWSPDGRTIAFSRRRAPAASSIALVLIPQRGGRERVLGEWDVSEVSDPLDGSYLAWTPDSKWLVHPVPETGRFALYLFSIETGERQRLTNPPADVTGDTAPSFSPDGGTLAFARESQSGFRSDLYLLRLAGGYRPQGEPERVRLEHLYNLGAAWTPDGREVVFASGGGLWRMAVSKAATPRRLAFAPENTSSPAIARQGNRLAYSAGRLDSNFWRVDLREPERKPGVPVQFVSSTRAEWTPAYSPGGERIAFCSDRSGTMEIWVCDSDGSNLMQLTSFGGPLVVGPKWSPDGQDIAFHANPGGNLDVYVISTNGGVPRRLTAEPGVDQWPYWSRDGHWLYFVSGRGGAPEIWKMPAGGGQAVQITRDPGADLPHQSPDGRFVYYSKGWPFPQSVWRVAAEGGAGAKVLDAVHPQGLWTVGKQGIYFFTVPDKQGQSDLSIYEFATGKARNIAAIERTVYLGFAVSPDGRTILYTQLDEAGSDLMLVENFR